MCFTKQLLLGVLGVLLFWLNPLSTVAEPIEGNPSKPFSVDIICVEYGDGVSGSLKASLLTLLGEVPGLTVRHDISACAGNPRSVVFAIGDTVSSSLVLEPEELSDLGDEGFVIRYGRRGAHRLIAVRGKARFGSEVNIGLGFALFAALEKVGFSFLHPLEPSVPRHIVVAPASFNDAQSPYWKIRGIHLHTMHPIELTNLLNGWGKDGPMDMNGFNNMLHEWQRFLEWMLANRLNRVQWVLLSSRQWAAYSESHERLRRLTKLVDMAHDFGIEVGVDTPIAMRQQNAFRLITKRASLSEELKELRQKIDWVMSAGFDFLASENGTTEFTHPDAERMLHWINEIGRHLDEKHGQKRVYMKVHVSSGQISKRFVDPVSGGPLNINFLPYHADRRVGVMPHTVEYYGLDDPAPTYGNSSFADIARYMQLEAGRREVVWYPETAYWCSFDIDVPLFLPLYAERRFRDLRILARWEQLHGIKLQKRVDGQVFFSSGWEWGYWLNDVIAARASWDPGRVDLGNDDRAFKQLLSEVFQNFQGARSDIVDGILDTARKQHEWLIWGGNPVGATQFKEQLTGQSYLQGEDTLDDLARLLSALPMVSLTPTQPIRASVLYGKSEDNPADITVVQTLLEEMEHGLGALAKKWKTLEAQAPRDHRELVRELYHSASITHLRARQARALFEYAVTRQNQRWDINRLNYLARVSMDAMGEADAVIAKQELLYRVDADRIASWKKNPTAYRFGYLWSVRSLLYWHRDHRRVVQEIRNVCLDNVIDPFEVSFGFSLDSPRFAPLRHMSSLIVDDSLWEGCLTISKP